MPRVELIDPETAPPETREAYEEIRSDWGGMLFTDWRPLGLSPQIMVAVHKLFFRLQGERGGSLTDVLDKELVAIKTSYLNGCDYCLGHNVDFGQQVGLGLDTIQAAVAEDYAQSEVLTDRQKALLRWTESVTRNTAEEDDEAFAALKEHYSDAEIAELTLMSGLFNMWNRFTRALHIELEPAEERQLTACLARTTPIQPSTR
ncbi:MAG TPA: carboxymuconolactone decarboxylase family protein [Gaiellaceae bacterium]|nr:carboxymuconolactone decarboxylase family protein [Gaiellaceae bacterium]